MAQQKLERACAMGDRNTVETVLSQINVKECCLEQQFEQLCVDRQFDTARLFWSRELVDRAFIVHLFVAMCYDLQTMRFLWGLAQLESCKQLKSYVNMLFGFTHFVPSHPNFDTMRFLWKHNIVPQNVPMILHALQFACLHYNTTISHFLWAQCKLQPKQLRAHSNFLFCCACDRGDEHFVKTLWNQNVVTKNDKSWLRCAFGHARARMRQKVLAFLQAHGVACGPPVAFATKHESHILFLQDTAHGFQQ